MMISAVVFDVVPALPPDLGITAQREARRGSRLRAEPAHARRLPVERHADVVARRA